MVKNRAGLEAEITGCELFVVNANNDEAIQLRGIKDWIQQKINVLNFAPVHCRGTASAVEAANKASIKLTSILKR